MPPKLAITVIEGVTSGDLWHKVATYTHTQPGEMEVRVRRGGTAGNFTFEALRAELDDDEAAIFSVPSIARATHWVAQSGMKAAVVANHNA